MEMTAGEKLRELRGDKSQEEVARAVMISDSALSSRSDWRNIMARL